MNPRHGHDHLFRDLTKAKVADHEREARRAVAERGISAPRLRPFAWLRRLLRRP